MITQERLKELFSYDPMTGIFTRNIDCSFRGKAGSVSGCKKAGYLVIRIDYRLYRAHRLAWLYVHGAWPSAEVDHINGIKDDNRIANLRDVPIATNRQNQKRARKNNSTGFLGVHYVKEREKYKAEITVDSENIHLGYFESPQAAYESYLTAKRKHHEGNTL